MIDFNQKSVMVIAPHPDDEVIGAGGLISRIKSQGGLVHVLFLTVGEARDFNGHGVSTSNQRIQEIETVADFLKFDDWKIAFPGNDYHLKLDHIPLKELIHQIERGEEISLEVLQPDIFIFPDPSDYNQDHVYGARAAFTACRPALQVDKFIPRMILTYKTPMDYWSIQTPNKVNLCIEISETDLDRKTTALDMYQSQIRNRGHLRSNETLRALSTLHGSLIGTHYAEGFYCHKLHV